TDRFWGKMAVVLSNVTRPTVKFPSTQTEFDPEPLNRATAPGAFGTPPGVDDQFDATDQFWVVPTQVYVWADAGAELPPITATPSRGSQRGSRAELSIRADLRDVAQDVVLRVSGLTQADQIRQSYRAE